MTKFKTSAEMMRDNMLVKHYAGSHAYGTNIATSDVDFRGIFVADPQCIRTPWYTVNEVNDATEEDTVIYELNQFMKLVLDCNPNVIETLWVDNKSITHTTPAYQLLREAAPKLLSTRAAYSFSGYAMSQLKRVRNHNKWINQQEEGIAKIVAAYVDQVLSKDVLYATFDEWVADRVISAVKDGEVKSVATMFGEQRLDKLIREPDVQLLCKLMPKQHHYLTHLYSMDYVNEGMFDNYEHFDGYRIYPLGKSEEGDIFHVYKADGYTLANPFTGSLNFDHSTPRPDDAVKPTFLVKYSKQLWTEHSERWKKYKQWRANRNETRSVLEEKFGYDTKHAMHLVRLLRMGKEILTDGKVNVFREDAKELLGIRNGDWEYHDLVEYAEKMDEDIRLNLLKQTSLQKKPDLQFAAELTMQVQDLFWTA